MAHLLPYLLKLSCGLALVYLFYRFALHRLTFYTANRWFLIGATILCFILPLINIDAYLENQSVQASRIVALVPALAPDAETQPAGLQTHAYPFLNIWNVAMVLFIVGIVVLLARLTIQFVSFRNIKKGAHLITDGVVKIYRVDKPIIPFSFGTSIFLNQQLHTESELYEIVRHEYVHVRQRHSLDIIWAEMICLLNWYNPAVWLLRHAVRQNLEFIADHNVINSGVDKKRYQYLLLKVSGSPQFYMAASFNFSSLKKRIVMINKMPSAKAHAIKFLLLLPLMAILLVAFRKDTEQKEAQTIAAINNIVQKEFTEPVVTELDESTLRNKKEKVADDKRSTKKKAVKKEPNKKGTIEQIAIIKTSEQDTLPKTKKPIKNNTESPAKDRVEEQEIENAKKEIEQSKIAIQNSKKEIEVSKGIIEENRIQQKEQKATIELQKQQIHEQRQQIEKQKSIVQKQAVARNEQKKALKQQEAQLAKQKEQNIKQEKKAAIKKKAKGIKE